MTADDEQADLLRNILKTQHSFTVYALFNSATPNAGPLYIGTTYSPERRLKEHKHRLMISTLEMEILGRFSTNLEANCVETAIIKLLAQLRIPTLNVRSSDEPALPNCRL
jgi:predicted GIY-YIG superfamily endonuclease